MIVLRFQSKEICEEVIVDQRQTHDNGDPIKEVIVSSQNDEHHQETLSMITRENLLLVPLMLSISTTLINM